MKKHSIIAVPTNPDQAAALRSFMGRLELERDAELAVSAREVLASRLPLLRVLEASHD
jgi:hypothetical protein